MTNHHDIFKIHEDPRWPFRGSGTAFLLHYPDLRGVQKIVKISRRKVIILTCDTSSGIVLQLCTRDVVPGNTRVRVAPGARRCPCRFALMNCHL